jgi:acyl-CoA synthetase (AMP-forming)/AMP-acid ligase II
MRGAMKNNAILNRWAATLERKRPAAAVRGRDGGVERTFADIESEATQWAVRLGRWKAGTVVGMQVGNSPAWPALVLAAMRMRLIPLPLGLHMAREEREMALATCGAGALISDERGSLEVQPRPELERQSRDRQSPDWHAPEHPECEFLKLTSGTTSRPRAIRFTAGQLAADCDNICETMGIGESDLNFGVIPFSHSYGFSNLITPLLCRGVPLVASEDRMPRAILEDLERAGATVFPGMPLFFEKLAGMEGAPALPALRLCVSAGAPLPARVGEAFSARFSRKVHTFYGSSECGGIGYDAGGERVYEEGFVGRAMRNVEIAPLEEGGRIAVRSAAVGDGYYPDPDPEVLGSGRFVPADLVRMGERGMYLVGRATDVINIAGRKLNPAEVEARLALCPGVRQVVVFGVASVLRNEEAVACVSGCAEPDAVLRYARTVLSGWQVPKDVWLVDEVPVNERGKVSRRDLARSYAERRGRADF